MAIDEVDVRVEDPVVYVWAAINVDTFDVGRFEVSPGRLALDVLFLKPSLKR